MSFLLLLAFIILNPLKTFNTGLRIGPFDWYNVMYLFLIIAWLLRRDIGWIKTSINKPLLVFIGFLIFSYIRGFVGPFPPDPMDTLQVLKTISSELFLFFVFLNFVETHKQIKIILFAMCLVMLYEGYVVFIQYKNAIALLGGSKFTWELKGMISGTFSLPGQGGFGTASANEVGAFFGIYTFVLIGLAIHCNQRSMKYVLLGLAFLFTFPLLFSFSRGAWLAFSLTILFYFLRNNRKMIFAIALLFILAFSLLPQSVVQRASSVEDKSAQGRLTLWTEAISAMTHPPYFIGGTGLEQAEHYVGKDAHNTYIKIMLETGIFGISSFLILLYVILKTLVTFNSSIEHPLVNGLLLGCFLAFVSFTIVNLTGTRMFNGALSAWLWPLLGVALKAEIIHSTDEERTILQGYAQ